MEVSSAIPVAENILRLNSQKGHRYAMLPEYVEVDIITLFKFALVT